MVVDHANIRLDECDGEPLCAICGQDLYSRKGSRGEIIVSCSASQCENHGKKLIVGSSYNEITQQLLVLSGRDFAR